MTTKRKQEILENLIFVHKNMRQVLSEQQREARLVAVSKYKPVEDLQYAYEHGQRHFGENYVQELVSKSQQLPVDINWHFIGHLQTNKCKSIAAIPNLYAVETIDSCKKANSLNKACSLVKRIDILRVFVQVNTSAEEVKSGVLPSETVETCRHILEECKYLKLQGLMTIGMLGRTYSDENPDFVCLKECKKKVENELNLENLELSMGMSSDYICGLKMGATSVRLGKTIFGDRKL